MNRPIISLILIALTSTGCASNTGTGVLAGGILGASMGGIMGGGGALIGAAVGVLGGGLIGAALDGQDRKTMEKSSPRTVDRMDRQEPLTLNDVIKLSQSGVSNDTILEYMRSTDSNYTLSKTQIRRLQDAGVSPQIIHFMMDANK
jgi:uncharacterized protein YcfJ